MISRGLFEEQVMLNTVLIENLTDNESGTGFLIKKEVSLDRSKVLLFSNKHVFWGIDDKDNLDVQKNLRITLHKKEKESTFVLGNTEVIEIIATPRSLNLGGYFEHPDTEIDIACFNISSITESFSAYVNWIDPQLFFDYEEKDLRCGGDVVFVGYPDGFYDEKHYLPLLRKGALASIPWVDFDGRGQMIIDAGVFPGSSGSPVYASIKGKYRLLGLVAQGKIRDLDFVDVANSDKAMPIVFAGLGVVWKSKLIRDVIDLVPMLEELPVLKIGTEVGKNLAK